MRILLLSAIVLMSACTTNNPALRTAQSLAALKVFDNQVEKNTRPIPQRQSIPECLITQRNLTVKWQERTYICADTPGFSDYAVNVNYERAVNVRRRRQLHDDIESLNASVQKIRRNTLQIQRELLLREHERNESLKQFVKGK